MREVIAKQLARASVHQRPKNPSFLRGIWEDRREAVGVILGDTFIFLLIVTILTGVHLYLEWLPYPPERKEVFSMLHFYAFLIIMVIFMSDLVGKIWACVFGGED